ncbi:flagellin [Ochrobactrum sp. POC9]|uniref:flagellin N-terminal helical domain-containing protein n=1 Tax=Brucella/Ochrobactrum group TaxID=2826938 RepID=UPI000D706D5B|nr:MULTISPECIES: flagellin [Brucella/Ochrobactrum group]PWU76231.1 flagellin [Ochrobactrum sp. POC9]
MASILTNASAMTALQTLANTNKNLATTQSRISTGMKVAEASDNAAYWSIATTMRSDNKANDTILSSLGLGGAKIDTAYTAVKDVISVVDQIKQKVLSAKDASADDRAKIQTEISALQKQLGESVKASYAGSNLLSTDSSKDPADDTEPANNFSVVASYNRDADGTVSTGSIDVDLSAIRLVDSEAGIKSGHLGTTFTVAAKDGTGADETLTVNILDLSVADTEDNTIDNKAIDDMLKGIEKAAGGLATAAATLGAAKTRVDLQTTFVKNLSDAVDRGIGSMVDADMNAESARLSALQVQQQLGVQALSIANSGTQNILSLFRG